MEHITSFVIVFLLILSSAVCSGLNIALMSLSVPDLRRKAKLGDVRAQRVLPLRTNSYLTLASILLINVGVVSATALVLGGVFSGLVAGIISTLLLVTFGEILPQALFVRHALDMCARYSGLMRLMIIVTYPVSKPLQLLLDTSFGHETALLHSRHELGIILTEHLGDEAISELDEDEVEIMRGALQLSEKRVREIMTPIESVYWVTKETVIDADKIDEIKLAGRSRIPVFDTGLTDCYGLILMKDLVDIDFDEEPQRVDKLIIRPTRVVGSMTALDTMFRKFIAAHSHLIPIERDDKIIGIVTIEDLLEEILGHEIEDETDTSLNRH